jgi:hypothetical protein
LVKRKPTDIAAQYYLSHSRKFMRRSLYNTVYRTQGSMAPWLNCSEPTELTIERQLTWFEVLGYTVLLQADIVSGRHQAILQNSSHGILGEQFRQAMRRINPTVPSHYIEAVLRQLAAPYYGGTGLKKAIDSTSELGSRVGDDHAARDT